MRRYLVLDNPNTDRVRQRPFKAAPRLNAHFTILDEYEKDGPIVLAGLPDFPRPVRLLSEIIQ